VATLKTKTKLRKGCTVGAVLIVVLTALSGGFFIEVMYDRWRADFTRGRVFVTNMSSTSDLAWRAGWRRPSYVLWFHFDHSPDWHWDAVSIPLWPFAGAMGAAALFLWKAERQAAVLPDRCDTCDYDRSGLTAETACPECGHAGPPRQVPNGPAESTTDRA
jgi:hypothetical protein